MERDRPVDRLSNRGALVQTPAGAAFFKRTSEADAELEFIVVEPEMIEQGSDTEAVVALMQRNVDSYCESIRSLASVLGEHVENDGGAAKVDLTLRQSERLDWQAGHRSVSIRPRLTKTRLKVTLDRDGSESANVMACAEALSKARVDSLRHAYAALLRDLNSRLGTPSRNLLV